MRARKSAEHRDVVVPVEDAHSPAVQAAEWLDPRASERARRASEARHASGRRRNIDPTTCDRDYSGEELEFMRAMEQYKHSSGRMFPTWSEVLEVLRALGYEKPADACDAPMERPAPGIAAQIPSRRAVSA